VQGIAITSYQGGHVEFFKYMIDLLRERGGENIKVFGGGGGVIVPAEIKELHEYGVTRIFSPEDGQKLGLQGMINEIVERATVDLAEGRPRPRSTPSPPDLKSSDAARSPGSSRRWRTVAIATEVKAGADRGRQEPQGAAPSASPAPAAPASPRSPTSWCAASASTRTTSSSSRSSRSTRRGARPAARCSATASA
jgi:hypothetical protein